MYEDCWPQSAPQSAEKPLRPLCSAARSVATYPYENRRRRRGLAILFDLPRPPQRAPGLRPGVLAVFQDLRAIDKHVFHADGELMRLLEGGAVGDGLRVEDDDVGEISFLQKSATIELQIGRGQTRQTADRFFEGNDLLFAHVFA